MSVLYVRVLTLPADWTEEERVRRAYDAVPSNYSKPESIDRWVKDNVDRIQLASARESMQGRLLGVGLAFDGDRARALYDETAADAPKLLKRLHGEIGAKAHMLTWVGHGIARVDIPWLFHHAARNRSKVVPALPKQLWDRQILDLADRWYGPRPPPQGPPASLGEMAEFLGVGDAGEVLDAAGVWEAWKAGEHRRIVESVCREVELVRAVNRVLSGEW